MCPLGLGLWARNKEEDTALEDSFACKLLVRKHPAFKGPRSCNPSDNPVSVKGSFSSPGGLLQHWTLKGTRKEMCWEASPS